MHELEFDEKGAAPFLPSARRSSASMTFIPHSHFFSWAIFTHVKIVLQTLHVLQCIQKVYMIFIQYFDIEANNKQAGFQTYIGFFKSPINVIQVGNLSNILDFKLEIFSEKAIDDFKCCCF